MSFLSRTRAMLGVLLLVIAFSAVVVPSTKIVNAQQQGASGLQISPTKQEFSIEPGEVKEVTFIIKNITNIEITAKMFLNDFESDNLTGQPKLKIDQKERTSSSLQSFIKGLTNIDLKPGESKEVKVTLDVPGNAAPGGYYGAIRFDATPKDGRSDAGRQVALTASVAPLILMQVNGDIKEQIDIQSVKAQKNNKPSSFFVSRPDKIATTIKNLGNGFSQPFGRIVVQNTSGKEVYSYELNNVEPRGNILPNSVRTFTDNLSNIKTPGRYRIIAAIAQGNGGEVVNYQSTFWYIPTWLIAVIMGLILALAATTYFVYHKKFGKRSSTKKRR